VEGDSLQERVPETVEVRADDLLDHLGSELQELRSIEEFVWLGMHPLDLNEAGKEDLADLPMVSEAEAEAVIRYRETRGRFGSVEQLLDLGADGHEIFRKISPFALVRDSLGATQQTVPHVLLCSRVMRTGSEVPTDASAPGSPLHLFSAITVFPADGIQCGALFEKDPGERVADGFVSGYLQWEGLPCHARVILGDFTVQTGLGLSMGRSGILVKGGFGSGESMQTVRDVRAYHSSGESGFLRGGAVSGKSGPGAGGFRWSLFWSQRSLDATLNDQGAPAVIDDAGLLRTETERRKHNALRERVYGGRLEFLGDGSWTLGSTVYRARRPEPCNAVHLLRVRGRNCFAGHAPAPGACNDHRRGFQTPRDLRCCHP